MNKTLTIVLSAFMILLVLGSVVGLWSLRQKNYNAESAEIQAQIDEKNIGLNLLKNEVDANNYRVDDVVKNFFLAARENNLEESKLYLSQEYKDIDILGILGFDFEKEDITINGISTSTTSSGGVIAEADFLSIDSNKKTTKSFYLIKEDGAWKITNIKDGNSAED